MIARIFFWSRWAFFNSTSWVPIFILEWVSKRSAATDFCSNVTKQNLLRWFVVLSKKVWTSVTFPYWLKCDLILSSLNSGLRPPTKIFSRPKMSLQINFFTSYFMSAFTNNLINVKRKLRTYQWNKTINRSTLKILRGFRSVLTFSTVFADLKATNAKSRDFPVALLVFKSTYLIGPYFLKYPVKSLLFVHKLNPPTKTFL